MTQNSERTLLFKEALRALVADHPESIVASLLMHFSSTVVMDLIHLYSGKALQIPNANSVMRSYRNKVIRDAIDTNNDRQTRERLATFFKLTPAHVSDIYREAKKRHQPTSRKGHIVVKRIYESELEKALVEAKGIIQSRRIRKL